MVNQESKLYTLHKWVKAPLTPQRPPKTPKTPKSPSDHNFPLEVALSPVHPLEKLGGGGGHSCNYFPLSKTLIGKARPFSGDELFSPIDKTTHNKINFTKMKNFLGLHVCAAKCDSVTSMLLIFMGT